MGKSTVTVYFNTGFGGIDIPKDPSVLNLATKKIYPDFYYVREDIDLPSIRIKDTYDNLCDVDYVKIENQSSGKVCYYFAAPVADAKNTTALALTLDALTTIGGAANVEFTSGIQTRGHISKEDDILYTKTSDEAFTPNEPMIVRNTEDNLVGAQVEDPSVLPTLKDTDIITSNVDILQLPVETVTEGEDKIKVITGILETEEENALMYFPKIELEKNSTRFEMTKDIDTIIATYRINNLSAYDANNSDVLKGLSFLVSCGQLQLQSSYTIPKEWEPVLMEGDKKFIRIRGCSKNKTLRNIPYELSINGYSIKNKKCHQYLRNLVLMNIASGDSSNMPIKLLKDLSSSDNFPTLKLWADPSPNGKPYARFGYISDSPQLFQNCVKGTQWPTNQLALNDSSGSLWNQLNFNLQNSQIDKNFEIKQNDWARGLIGSVTDTALKFFEPRKSKKTTNTLPSDPRNPVYEGASYSQFYELASFVNDKALEGMELENQRRQNNYQHYFDNMANTLDYAQNTRIQYPYINFTPDPSLNLYGYNYFVVYDITMSDNDIKKLDDYFQRYGYSGLNIPLTKNAFSKRQYYNYVEAYDINIKSTFGMRIRNSAIRQLNSGVRAWAVLPDKSYYELN